jgi:hypothetical protein
LYGFGERCVASGRCVSSGRERSKDVCGKERKTEGEVGVREDGERLDEDIGDGLVTCEVGVELVSVCVRLVTDDGGNEWSERNQSI